MPKIEKDCHAFTISAEREKRRGELASQNQQAANNNNNNTHNNANHNGPAPNQGRFYQNPQYSKSNPFFQKQANFPPMNAYPANNAMNMGNNRGKGNYQNYNASGPNQQQPVPQGNAGFYNKNALQENLAGTRPKGVYRADSSSQNPQTAKSDSTQDTDILAETRHEDSQGPRIGGVNPQASMLGLGNNPHDKHRNVDYDPREGGKQRQDLSEFENIAKKQYLEAAKRVPAPANGNGNGAGVSTMSGK